ncbi:hypothetical protein CXG81DRAFT_28787 [Caulochytrium protostelioides]|uniref:Uncharacterized protein n=1 Tax=Caulochytrium protostelioides TaxID=1555241 RepID=A0A4P9X0I9_9FUNG|nr:hypothetical protein CXG81DRAFT_28787 [Caulochytrium protostelioides]|eukprot:RKO98375.1 hypothetical protein CXG81DRAFT_28787 [Caulochytrium protostelioides]
MHRHYSRLLADATGHSRDRAFWLRALHDSIPPHTLSRINEDFTHEQLRRSLQRTPNWKATGGDNVSSELLKKAYDLVPQEAMLAKATKAGIRGRCLHFLRGLYEASSARTTSCYWPSPALHYSGPATTSPGIQITDTLSSAAMVADRSAKGTTAYHALRPTFQSSTIPAALRVQLHLL